MIKRRLSYIFIGSLILLASLLLISCGSDGDGISSYFFATTNNPGVLSVNFSYTGNATPSASNPLCVFIITNIRAGFPYTAESNIHTTVTFTTNLTNIMLTNITVSPVYIIACLETETYNTNLDKNEPFIAYSAAYDISNMTALKVYGGQTNSATIALNDDYRFRNASLTVNLSYTGTNVVNSVTNMMLAAFTGTNFTTMVTSVAFSSSTTNYTFSGITNTALYFVMLVDKDNSSGYSTGDPLEIYNETNYKNAATAISFTTNVTSIQTVTFSFGDTWTNW